MEWLWKSLLVCLLFPQQEWTSTGLNADLMSIQEFSIWSYLRCSMWSADIFTYIFMSSLQLRIPRGFAVMMAIKKLVDKVTKPLRHKLIQILVSIRLWPQQINKNQQLLLFLLQGESIRNHWWGRKRGILRFKNYLKKIIKNKPINII